jgi:hypothetical protein
MRVIHKEHEMGRTCGTYTTYAKVSYRVLVGKPEGKRTDGVPRLKFKKLKWNANRMWGG